MLEAAALTPTLVLEPRLIELFVPFDWLKLAVPVPLNVIVPGADEVMLNIWSGSAFAAPANNGAAARTAATKSGRFMVWSSKWCQAKCSADSIFEQQSACGRSIFT